MSSKTSKSLKQSTLSFGASKATAAANRAKKDAGTVTAEPSSSSSKRPTRSATKAAQGESNFDDIELSKSEPSSEEEIEQGDSEEYTEDKHDKGKGAAVKRETRASKAKAKVAKKEDEAGKQSVEEIAASRPNLDVKDRAYDQISSETRKKMGHLKTIHPTVKVEDKDVPQNRVDDILRVFDMNYEFGPCVGMTRLERWQRADRLGLKPPPEVYDILMTKEGLKEDRYAQNVLYGRV